MKKDKKEVCWCCKAPVKASGLCRACTNTTKKKHPPAPEPSKNRNWFDGWEEIIHKKA